MKERKGKLRWDLMPFQALDEVVRVFQNGAEKYSDWGWLKEPNPQQTYFAAAMRHLSQYGQGLRQDPDSGLHPMAHVVADALIVLAHDLMGTASTHSESPHNPPPQSDPEPPDDGPSPPPNGEQGPDMREKSHRVSAAWTVLGQPSTTPGGAPSSSAPGNPEERHLID